MTIYHQTDLVTLYQGDCLEVMPQLEARSFDCILADLPYGLVSCKWDSVIPFEPLWEQYKRLIKPNGAIVLFGSQPFTTDLIMSNRAWFKYCWVWEKDNGKNFLNAKNQPLKVHEDICVFSKYAASPQEKVMQYNPQFLEGKPYTCKGGGDNRSDQQGGGRFKRKDYAAKITRVPRSVIKFGSETGCHPTQKPIALLEYLVRTYTNEGDTILDNTCGSGSLLVAARNTNRRAVGIEMDEGYCRVAAGRLGRFEPSEFEVDKKAVEGQLGLFGAIA